MSQKENQFGIRQVVELTGISEFKLRVWELRYKAFNPERTKTGRRLYNRDQIIKINLLLKLSRLGYRISKIIHLSSNKLHLLIEEASSVNLVEKIKDEPGRSKDRLVKKILDLVLRHDWDKLSALLSRQVEVLEAEEFVFKLILPLFSSFNRMVNDKQISIAQEHILVSLIKDSLCVLKSRQASSKTDEKIRLVLATSEGESHDVGILIASLLASIKKKKILYLGPNIPSSDLAEASLRFNATHLLLSSTCSINKKGKREILNYVNFLDRQLPKKIVFWLAGPHLNKQSLNLNRDFKMIYNFKEFLLCLKQQSHF